MVLAERLVLSFSSVIEWFRSVYCSRLEIINIVNQIKSITYYKVQISQDYCGTLNIARERAKTPAHNKASDNMNLRLHSGDIFPKIVLLSDL